MYLSLNLHSSGCSGRVRGCVKSKGGSEEGGTKKIRMSNNYIFATDTRSVSFPVPVLTTLPALVLTNTYKHL